MFRRSNLLPIGVLGVIVFIFLAHSSTPDSNEKIKSKRHKYDHVKHEKQVQQPALAEDYVDSRIKRPAEMEPVLARPANGQFKFFFWKNFK